MYFQFGTRKIVEAAGVLLRSSQHGRMGRLRLLKLLYIADRESLRETGRPIVGTKLVAMDLGPVHSEVYDLIKGAGHGSEVWSQFINSGSRDLKLVADPGIMGLSRYEVEKLQETAAAYRGMSDAALAKLTHGFEEWVKNHRASTSRPIPLGDVLRAIGRAEEEGEIVKDARQVAAFNRLFGIPS
jgi:uncharacterized phage-associated protein